MKLKRVFIIGNMGSGKSTLAKKISKKLNIQHYDLDNIFWTRKFNKKRNETNRDKKFKELCNKKEWIIEGAYSTWIEYGIKEADLVVLLKPSLISMLWRITKRSVKREKLKELGKVRYKQSFRDYFDLLKATIKYYYRKDDRGYSKHKELIDNNDVKFVILKTNKEVNDFMENIATSD